MAFLGATAYSQTVASNINPINKLKSLPLIFILTFLTSLTFAQNDKTTSEKINMNKNVPNSVEIIDNHLDQFFEKDADIKVFDEIESEIIHRDVYMIKASENLTYNILLSCGMSALPMVVPEDFNASEYAEVMMLLPKEWKLEYESFSDEKNYWPIRLIKELMMLPHPNKTWLGYGHTYGSADDKEFAEGVGFNSVMLAYSMELTEDFTTVELENNKQIDIFTLIPLYKEELEFKKKNGASELLKKFDKFDIGEIVKIGRKNVCE